MSSLHDTIMNLPCERTMSHFVSRTELVIYKEGHRDARHAAAELANAADSRIEVLESSVSSLTSALKAAKQYVIQTDDYGRSYSDDVLVIINKALGTD